MKQEDLNIESRLKETPKKQKELKRLNLVLSKLKIEEVFDKNFENIQWKKCCITFRKRRQGFKQLEFK